MCEYLAARPDYKESVCKCPIHARLNYLVTVFFSSVVFEHIGLLFHFCAFPSSFRVIFSRLSVHTPFSPAVRYIYEHFQIISCSFSVGYASSRRQSVASSATSGETDTDSESCSSSFTGIPSFLRRMKTAFSKSRRDKQNSVRTSSSG